jgi:periplasmic divalent cation tolerance protein
MSDEGGGAGGAPAADVRVVLSTAPDSATASRLAHTLVEERLAACVTVVPGARSTYRWGGEVRVADEILLLIKTTAATAPALATRIQELHPYEVPEVIAVEPVSGTESYLAWLAASVGPPVTPHL